MNFKIVGVFRSKQRDEDGVRDAQTIYLPNTTMQLAFNMGDDIGWFAFLPSEGVAATIVEEKVRDLLAHRHHVHPDDKQAFGVANVEEEYKQVQGLFAGIKCFSRLVAIGTIIAGMVGVGNIMMIIVKERTQEIGIRKAIGARPFSIITMIILESLVITGVSGYFGLLLGVGVIEGISYSLVEFGAESECFANPEINFQVAASAITVLLVTGTIAGLIPGSQAVRLNPVLA